MGGHIPFQKIDIWLQGYRSLWLSTTRIDGRPHCVPIWYVWLPAEPAVYIATHHSSVKAHNLIHQPAVVLCAGNADDTIVIEGTTRLVQNDEEKAKANQLWMEKYVDPHSGTRATIGHPDDRIYFVTIHKMMVWEYGIIDTRTDWHFN